MESLKISLSIMKKDSRRAMYIVPSKSSFHDRCNVASLVYVNFAASGGEQTSMARNEERLVQAAVSK